MTDHSEDRVTIWMSAALRDRMDDRINYPSESRSQWTREAVQYRLFLADECERRGLDVPADADAREALVREILTAGIASVAEE
jgi:hypothetical protein